MLFVFHILDNPGTAEQRLALRPAHYEHLGKVEQNMITGGPLLAEDGETMIGSLLVIDFENKKAAQKWLDEAPFTTGGVFGEASIKPYKQNWPRAKTDQLFFVPMAENPDGEVKLYKSDPDALQVVLNGQIDAAITDAVSGGFAVKTADLDLRLLDTLE